MSTMNELLRDFFKEKGISQTEVAEKLGVTKATVNRYFIGHSKFGKVQAEKWSNLFGISKAFLLTGEGPVVDNEDEKNDERVASLTDTIRILSETIQEKDKTIANLKAYIAELETKLNSYH